MNVPAEPVVIIYINSSKHFLFLMQKFVANSSHAINKQKKMSTDEVDNATDSERRVLAAGGDNMEISSENVHLTENRG